ncbi:DNA methylase N-4/N-6 [Methylophilales bacterium HTCC2181]|uniref:Methyltransferase n=1 Tax=Methylophilales bacterium HTCC2181 TaxID=383631 RepID=A0P7F9_9PROT|nr:DNA methylase N-4/N-6 [Methylophilales bacterium HTCC2181]
MIIYGLKGIELKSKTKDTQTGNISFSNQEYSKLLIDAKIAGFTNIKDYLLSLHNNLNPKKTIRKQEPSPRLKTIHKTDLGKIICGDSLKWMAKAENKKSVNLIVTSPPFGLLSKKSYGNENSENYCDWFRSFAESFNQVLADDGSLVIDIQGVWSKGIPARSLYHFKLLQMLCEEYGFYLCQEHYWWNPSKLPSPAEWVTVKRVRVKDAVNCIWWLSKTPNPKANNKKILTSYSESMLSVLSNGFYNKGTRPSGHKLSKSHFSINHGGSIPPNLIVASNAASCGPYFDYCKKYGLKIHPARFPYAIPDYFIRFLTNENDLILDPFAGSSVTGFVAEKNNRKWIAIEKDIDFANGGKGHFANKSPYKLEKNEYTIRSPHKI